MCVFAINFLYCIQTCINLLKIISKIKMEVDFKPASPKLKALHKRIQTVSSWITVQMSRCFSLSNQIISASAGHYGKQLKASRICSALSHDIWCVLRLVVVVFISCITVVPRNVMFMNYCWKLTNTEQRQPLIDAVSGHVPWFLYLFIFFICQCKSQHFSQVRTQS